MHVIYILPVLPKLDADCTVVELQSLAFVRRCVQFPANTCLFFTTLPLLYQYILLYQEILHVIYTSYLYSK